MLRLFLSAIAIGFFLKPAKAQQSTEKSEEPRCSFSEVYRKGGWTVPGLKGSKPKGQRRGVGGWPGLFIAALQPNGVETNFELAWCPYLQPGRLVIEDEPIKIYDLWAYSFGDRVFAYRVQFAPEAIHRDGTRGEIASMSAVFFCDVDGSGLFTTMMYPGSLHEYYKPPCMPAGLKKGAE
jgi:hypothetical protein